MATTTIQFSKMHGLGNDFVVVNALQYSLPSLSIPKLADRRFGIGFDQLLVLEPSARADFFCRIFNADGSEAEQCGNGLRCLARFIHENKLETRTAFNIETKAGIFPVVIEDYDHISVIMGLPNLDDANVEIDIVKNHPAILAINVLTLGNPHAILHISSLTEAAPIALGEAISKHSFFPQGTNVGFMQIVNREHILLRTFERGTGMTLACGSNACAAVAVGIKRGWLERAVKVEFSYGALAIKWDSDQDAMEMMGPASQVFCGEINYLNK